MNAPRPLTTRVEKSPLAKIGNRCGVYRHEMDSEVAEYRLRHDGILPELLAYIVGCGLGSKRL